MLKTVVVLLLILGSTANAEQISPRIVTFVQVYEDFAVAALETPHNNETACSRSNAGNFVAVNSLNTTGKEMFATLLAARLSERPVGFGTSGCRTWGSSTIPLIYRIDL